MILEFNKFNVILYFLTGTTIAVGFKRFIYGSLIVIMSAFILLQTLVLRSNNVDILRYQNIIKIPAFLFLVLLIIVSLFVLQKSTVEVSQKLFSLLFLLLSLGLSLTKGYFKDNPIFSLPLTNYIPSLLFMIVLLSVSVIPDNQEILEREYVDLKGLKGTIS